ncbi:hypothetical protein A2368_04470 [Candidatus Collierbacteria bacterium RIFOXYB1_FULL_49_13]|uniref:Aspartyl/glutamyl-tRNA(Asn/Gln) amidotransferase subunit C n=1 Tax=Candidatus Collierbacteria bacterium RIFOXYB1_FULL_49_13 TaxID=1817728 RepID=A0A1F5FJN2_9BACT|nr:MAG: hypothetical protein A2368_04470 [Candidatus Collierbacteria bacterium RIFOXYB1_FULL_49_13]
MLTAAELDHLAGLAHLELTPDQKQSLLPQLNDIIGFIGQLQKIPTDQIDITSEVTGLSNVGHDDLTKDCLPQKLALENAIDSTRGYVRVPAIFNDDDHS